MWAQNVTGVYLLAGVHGIHLLITSNFSQNQNKWPLSGVQKEKELLCIWEKREKKEALTQESRKIQSIPGNAKAPVEDGNNGSKIWVC